MGREACAFSVSSLHSGGGELACRLLELPTVVPGGMVPASRGFFSHMPKVGYPGHRSIGVQVQQEVGHLCVKDKGFARTWDRCASDPLGSVFTDLCVPPVQLLLRLLRRIKEEGKPVILVAPARPRRVCRVHKVGSREIVDSSIPSRLAFTRTGVPLCLTIAKFNGFGY